MNIENKLQENAFDVARNFEKYLGKYFLKKMISTIHEKSRGNILKGEGSKGCVFFTEEILKLENEEQDYFPQIKITLTGKVSEFYKLFSEELRERMEQIDDDAYRIKEWKQNIKIYENEEKKKKGDSKSFNERSIVSEGVLKVNMEN